MKLLLTQQIWPISSKNISHLYSVIRNVPQQKIQTLAPPSIQHPLQDLIFNENDIEEAIMVIKPHSSCPPFEIPEMVLKKCKSNLSYPIKRLWERSYAQGRIPSHYKFQHITPIHKKDSKAFAPTTGPYL